MPALFGLFAIVLLLVACAPKATKEFPPTLSVVEHSDLVTIVFTVEPPGDYTFNMVAEDGFASTQVIDANVLTMTVTSAGCVTVTAYAEDGLASNPVHACGGKSPA